MARSAATTWRWCPRRTRPRPTKPGRSIMPRLNWRSGNRSRTTKPRAFPSLSQPLSERRVRGYCENQPATAKDGGARIGDRRATERQGRTRRCGLASRDSGAALRAQLRSGFVRRADERCGASGGAGIRTGQQARFDRRGDPGAAAPPARHQRPEAVGLHRLFQGERQMGHGLGAGYPERSRGQRPGILWRHVAVLDRDQLFRDGMRRLCPLGFKLGHGWVARADIQKAKDDALSDCRKKGKACRIIASVCADGAQRLQVAN